MTDFFMSALPFVIMGIGVAIVCAVFSNKNKEDKKD